MKRVVPPLLIGFLFIILQTTLLSSFPIQRFRPDILLITDYNSAIDSIVERTRAKAIVEGKGENRCQLKYLLRADEVALGDVVVTSGLGGNFPKGLMVGEIKKVDKKGHGVFQFAELIPSVDMTQLEEVFIIMEPPSPTQPPEEKGKKGKKTKK